MPEIEIRELYDEQIGDAFHWVPSYGFHASPPMATREEWWERVSNRPRDGSVFLGLFEDGQAVACAASTALTQNVRGRVFGAGGVFDVATHPGARRKGYSHRVLAALLGRLREQGRPLSALYPFNDGFYQALGYVQFPEPRAAEFPPERLSGLLERDWGVDIELVPSDEGYDEYMAFEAEYQPRVHGLARFEYPERPAPGKGRLWIAFAREGGRTTGAMLYRLKGEQIMNFTMQVRALLALTPQARYGLLSWIPRHNGQATKVELWLGPDEAVETWWPDLRPDWGHVFVAPMSRVVDLAGIGGMQVGSGELAIEVSDPQCPWNDGNWRLASRDGVLDVSRGAEPECALSIQGLSALVYGTHDPDVFAIRGWGEPSDGVRERMRELFPARTPFLLAMF